MTQVTRWNALQDYLKEIKVTTGSYSSIAEVDAICSLSETIKTAKMIAEVEIVPELMQLFPELDFLIKENKRVIKRWQWLETKQN